MKLSRPPTIHTSLDDSNEPSNFFMACVEDDLCSVLLRHRSTTTFVVSCIEDDLCSVLLRHRSTTTFVISLMYKKSFTVMPNFRWNIAVNHDHTSARSISKWAIIYFRKLWLGLPSFLPSTWAKIASLEKKVIPRVPLLFSHYLKLSCPRKVQRFYFRPGSFSVLSFLYVNISKFQANSIIRCLHRFPPIFYSLRNQTNPMFATSRDCPFVEPEKCNLCKYFMPNLLL